MQSSCIRGGEPGDSCSKLENVSKASMRICRYAYSKHQWGYADMHIQVSDGLIQRARYRAREPLESQIQGQSLSTGAAEYEGNMRN